MGADYDVTVRSTLGQTSMFIDRVLPCTHTGLIASLLNNRTKILLLYDFIIESVKYCCNNHDLHDTFTNTLTTVNTNYWLPVRWKLHILAAGKNIFILRPGDKLPPPTSRARFCHKFFDLYTSIR